jgi:hypothetical protein
MEKGLPTSAELSVKRSSGWVYDLVYHKPVSTSTGTDQLKFQVSLGPGDGRVFMITETKIGGVRIDGPTQARLGDPLNIHVAVTDESGAPVDAVVPVQVEISDPKGRLAEFSGHYGAMDGEISITVDLAKNSLPGKWTIRSTELASGLSCQKSCIVQPAQD